MNSVSNLIIKSSRDMRKQSYLQIQYRYLLNLLSPRQDLDPYDLYRDMIQNFDNYMMHNNYEDQLKMVYYFGIHNLRKSFFARAQQNSITILKSLRGKQYELTKEDLNSTVNSLGNLQIRDKGIMQKCLEEFEQDICELSVYQLINLQWCFLKLGYTDEKVVKLFTERLQTIKEEPSLHQSLRILWVYSLTPTIDLTYALDQYVKLSQQALEIYYTPKDAYYFVQILFNVYPEVLGQLKENQFRLSPLSSNKYAQYFDEMYVHYERSVNLLKNNVQTKKQSNSEYNVLYERTSNGQFQIREKFTPNMQANNQSKFEKNIKKNLTYLPFSFTTNQYCSIYEIDFIIEDKVLLETNGVNHIIRDIDDDNCQDSTLNHKMKQKHLKLMGYDKIIELNFREWQKVDPKSKQITLLKQLIQAQLQI